MWGGVVFAFLILHSTLFYHFYQELPDSIASLNLMDKSSLGYAYRGGASDVERTLKTLATGVGGSHSAMAEVSLKSVSQLY